MPTVRIENGQRLELPSGQIVRIKEDNGNFSVHFLKAAPMQMSAFWPTGAGKDVEVDLVKSASGS
jgi:hypothetical protein